MKKYDVAAYIWPSYTGDEPRSRIFWEEGIGEWQTVKKSKAKFEGHDWPRKPLWGYVNEADPYVMEMQIEAATDHGVNVFIYDWYWYDGRPYLEQCLNNGFLQAKNNHKMRFYLMWANHTVDYLWDRRNAGICEADIWRGAVDRPEFEKIADRLLDKYFHLPNYYCIGGKPVFMIYDIMNLINGLGGIAEVKKAFQWFNARAKEKGHKGMHFMLSTGSAQALGHADKSAGTPGDILNALGFDSLSNYQFVSFLDIDRDYLEILQDAKKEWAEMDRTYDKPYFPHVSVGWDNNPRFLNFRPGIMKNTTPANIKEAFEAAKSYIDSHPNQPPLVTINSWNEWTETSYLQPDDLNGYGYLEAVKSVFLK